MNLQIFRIQHVLYVEKKCKYNKVSNVFLVNMFFIKIVYVHGFNDNKLVCLLKKRLSFIRLNIDIKGPICRTTVLRPTPPRTVPTPPPQPNVQPAAAPHPQAQAPVPPPPSASATPSSSNSPTSNLPSPPNTNTIGFGTFPQMPFNSFPMVLPPFGKLKKKLREKYFDLILIYLAFPPPPLPPLNFSDMSEEAIRAMEGTELAHVQARLQCLRNVRNLLDASMVQMQQYMNIVSTQRFNF